MPDAIRLPAERRDADELAALAANDSGPRPLGWHLSPRAVQTYLVGRDAPLELDGRDVTIKRKFYGDDRLVQRAIVSLASDRGLLLIGEPGTAKSWLSEHLAAAISGTSLLTVQGSAGITEDQITYGWNYALLLAEGPSPRALVPGPLLRGMREGKVVRFEEITRAPHEVQDTLLSALSDKVMIIPELPESEGVVLARPGFTVLATANTRDRGVNEMSAALKRRFNFETVQPLTDVAQEVAIVRGQVASLVAHDDIRPDLGDDVLELLVTTFQEIRRGRTTDGVAVDRTAAVMSTAEAVSVAHQATLHAAYFADGRVTPEHVVHHLAGAAVKDLPEERRTLRKYWEVAVKPRAVREVGRWREYWAARSLLDD
ncbi:MAG: MoxR-like ATPase [Myxococcota bacterium]|jgi:MoxR-like ATPase